MREKKSPLVQDDGGESTEPENTGKTMYFGQVSEEVSNAGLVLN
jgi:hypothetical protein